MSSSTSNENKTNHRITEKIFKDEISIAETIANNTTDSADTINYIITSCAPKDMNDDAVIRQKPFSNWETETEENLSEFHKSVASSKVTITDTKSETYEDTEELKGDFYSEQVILQNKMLQELNAACEGIFELEKELFANESEVVLKIPTSEDAMYSALTSAPKNISNENYGFSCDRRSDSNQTFIIQLDDDLTSVAERDYVIDDDNASVEKLPQNAVEIKTLVTQTFIDEEPTKETNEMQEQRTKEGHEHNNDLNVQKNSEASPDTDMHYATTERLEDIARNKYEAARAVFKSKENESLQNASVEIAIKTIINNNNVETKSEFEKAIKEEDFSVLYHNIIASESLQDKLKPQGNKRKESSTSFDSWKNDHNKHAGRKGAHSEYSMDATKLDKPTRRPVSQISERLNLKQLLKPEGLEMSNEKKEVLENATERGDELAVKEKPAVVSYEDLMRVLASPTSESSIFTEAVKTRVAEGLHSSPSDSRLLPNERRAAEAAAQKLKESAPKVKNLEEELHYHNPFQAVFRRAALTDVNELYKFMDYECEEDLEELQKPLSTDYFENLIMKIQETDKQLRAMHKKMFGDGLMEKLAAYFRRTDKLMLEETSDSEWEDEEEESISDRSESTEK